MLYPVLAAGWVLRTSKIRLSFRSPAQGLSRRRAERQSQSKIPVAVPSMQDVKISSFGRFTVRDKGLRVGRKPKTGETVPILPRRVVAFRASGVLKQRINEAIGERP